MQYQIVNKSQVGILAISGDITRGDKEILEKCQQEVGGIEAKVMVIFFKNVSTVEPSTFRDLTLIQHELRKKMDVRVVGLDLQTKMALSAGGVIRLAEVRSSLDEAITL
jgi:hypothetical protein